MYCIDAVLLARLRDIIFRANRTVFQCCWRASVQIFSQLSALHHVHAKSESVDDDEPPNVCFCEERPRPRPKKCFIYFLVLFFWGSWSSDKKRQASFGLMIKRGHQQMCAQREGEGGGRERMARQNIDEVEKPRPWRKARPRQKISCLALVLACVFTNSSTAAYIFFVCTHPLVCASWQTDRLQMAGR